ncbi:Hypothetical predicted protein [Olea europaea subsp. europaea]|uniref:Uncharacterized protein n=1 Tax=Olea europaea subsp. europaea TaxID=158383 RepID=A0A8S0U2Z0_OLEEU|nr:Hypothetical predicted protein [Olea europaea subsp. europaea]
MMQNSKFKPIRSSKPTSPLKTTMLTLENPAVDPGDSSRTVDLSEDTLKKGVSEEDMKLDWDGETMPIGETEPATVESEGDNNVNHTDVINMETEEIGEELTIVNLGEDSIEKMCKEMSWLGKMLMCKKIGET